MVLINIYAIIMITFFPSIIIIKKILISLFHLKHLCSHIFIFSKINVIYSCSIIFLLLYFVF